LIQLPAQNATGNWIKIVQRVPVRIALQLDELAAHPLRVGLSMEARVDVRNSGGKMLSDVPRAQPLASTAVFDAAQRRADDEIERIVAANLGRAGAGVARAAKPRAHSRPMH
jgi:membrane fusion protein, multidrug efflux system